MMYDICSPLEMRNWVVADDTIEVTSLNDKRISVGTTTTEFARIGYNLTPIASS